MTDKPQAKTILGAFFDFIILCLLLGGAGFGGYVVGINQKVGPIQLVPAGTPGAISLTALEKSQKKEEKAAPEHAKGEKNEKAEKAEKAKPVAKAEEEAATESSSSEAAESSTQTSEESAPAPKASTGRKLKYWLSSSGADYTGYSITVKVNGTPVDNFFGPGKSVDITRLVKHGDNTINYEAKALGEQYNKHSGEASYILAVKLVKGPVVQEEFSNKDVVLIYARNASETEDFNDTKHFKGD